MMFDTRNSVTFLKLLFSSCLIFSKAITFSHAHISPSKLPPKLDALEFEYKLPNDIQPKHYLINLTLHIAKEGILTYDGTMHAHIVVRNIISDICLHMGQLEVYINETKLIRADNKAIVFTPHHFISPIMQVLMLRFKKPLQIHPGEYILIMKFKTPPDGTKGFTSIKHIKKHDGEKLKTWFFATKFHPLRTRELFPCWDEPSLKATFLMHITHPSDYYVLTNSRIKREMENGKDNVLSEFYTTPPISTYAVAIDVVPRQIVAPFLISNSTVYCRQILLTKETFYDNTVSRAKQELRLYINDTDKIIPPDTIVVPGNFRNLESWRLLTIGEEDIYYNEQVDLVQRNFNLIATIVHGMAYQLFGGLVSPSSWPDAWLNDVLASYFQYLILDKTVPEQRIMDIFVVHFQQLSFRSDNDSQTYPLIYNNLPSLLNKFPANYRKGSFIMRMFQHMLTDDIFQRGINAYLNKYSYNSTTPDNFWNTLKDVEKSGRFRPNLCCNLAEMFNEWLTKESYPVVSVIRDNYRNAVIVSQSYFNQQGTENSGSWWIPLTFATESNPDFLHTDSLYFLKPNEPLWFYGWNTMDWIICNVQQVGYYRVKYDNLNWLKIAAYLNSDNFTKIHVLNRAQIIDDAYYFLMKGQLNSTTFFELMRYLEKETDFIAWYPMKNIVPELWSLSQHSEGSFIKDHLLTIWNGILNEVGYIENPEDNDIIKAKRSFAIEWACKIGNTRCIEMAHKLFNVLFSPHSRLRKRKFTSSEKVLVCASMAEKRYVGRDKQDIWETLWLRYKATNKEQELEHFTCAENASVIIYFLDKIALTNKHLVNTINKEHERIFLSIIKKHIGKNIVFNHILYNLLKLKPRSISTIEALIYIIKHVRTKKHCEEIKRYIELYIHEATLITQATKQLAIRLSQIKQDLVKFQLLTNVHQSNEEFKH